MSNSQNEHCKDGTDRDFRILETNKDGVVVSFRATTTVPWAELEDDIRKAYTGSDHCE